MREFGVAKIIAVGDDWTRCSSPAPNTTPASPSIQTAAGGLTDVQVWV